MANSYEKFQQSCKNNPGTQSTAGSAIMSCPAQACEVTALAVNCAHYGKGRDFILDAINSEPNHNNTQRALQVISKSDKPDEINVSFSGACATGSKDCPSVKVTGGDENMLGTSSPYKFKVLPKPVAKKSLTFISFLSKYLIPDPNALSPTKYTIQNHKCFGSGQHKVVVEVFPTFVWGGSLTFGFYQPDGTQKKTLANKNEKGHWGLKGKLDLGIGTRKWCFEASTQQKKTSDVNDYFPTLKGMVGGLVEKLESIASYAGRNPATESLVKLDVGWPEVTIGGNIALLESQKDYNIDLGGKINLDFAPLIKVVIKTDLIDWCIMMGKSQGYGEFLKYIREKAKKGVGGENANVQGEILLELDIKGEINTKLEWTKSADDKWLSTEGTVANEASAGVTIGLVGRIKAKAKVFWVQVTFGVEIHVKGARNASEGIGVYINLVATTDQEKPALGGSLLFTGASIYYTYYAETGGNEVESDVEKKVEQAQGRGGKFGSAETETSSQDTKVKLKEEELKKLVEIFPYSEWPKKEAISSDASMTGLNQVKL